MQTPHILIVEDELVTRNTLKSIFEAEGYDVFEATDGAEMHQILSEYDINLVIMDINLPGKNGLLLARELREQANVALMFLTGRDNEVDKILGLEIGADDYITKPFNPRELTIRARNLLSRTMNLGTVSEERRSVESYKFNGWELDINSRSLIGPDGEQYKLPRSEFRAMLHFCENPGKIQSRAELLKKMTGRELKPHDRTVDVTIRRIRKHFESTPDTPLTSNWPHPSFLGDFLPAKREVSESGFQAHWQSSWFANNLGERFASGNDTGWENFPAFSVAVTTPADQYQLTDRATKYAILLIALTFMAFFVFETLTAQRLHPMQYLLVGLSLVMFYLLLLALSEHTGFTVAWIIASLIGAIMNGIYLQAVLKGWCNSMLFTLALLLLDGVMWGLLNSADSALLLGTSVLVVALAGMMFVTRNIDWYAFSLPKMKASKEVTTDDELRIWK